MTDPDPDPSAELGYAEALRELEGIVAELEGEAVDVDRLSQRVRRAAELVRMLRGRIGDARMEVTRVLADLDAATDGATPEPDPGAPR